MDQVALANLLDVLLLLNDDDQVALANLLYIWTPFSPIMHVIVVVLHLVLLT